VADDTVIGGESEIKPWTLVNKQSITRMDLPIEISKDDEDSSSEDDDIVEIQEEDDEDVVGIQEEDFTSMKISYFNQFIL